MTKSRKCFIIINSIKFNDTKIKFLTDKSIILKRKSANRIFLIKQQNSSFINAREIIKLKLILKNQYIVQRVKNAYMIFICQSKTLFDFFYAVQTIKIISNNITTLNKRLK